MGDISKNFSREEFKCLPFFSIIEFKCYKETQMLEKDCKVCGSKYETYPSINKKTCSRRCSLELKKQEKLDKYKCACEVCGIEFMPKRPKEGGRFCSYACSGVNSRLDRVERNGYWYKFVEGHPNASKQGYVAEHHLVMEEHLGHYIEDGFCVHHIDEDKKNNNLSNLQYMTDSEHKSHHAKIRERSNGRYI